MTSLGRHEGPQKIILNFTQNICSTCGFSTFHSQNNIGTPLHILNPSNYSCPRHFHTSTKARFGTTTQSVASSFWPNSGWTRHKSIGYFLVFQFDDWLIQIFTNMLINTEHQTSSAVCVWIAWAFGVVHTASGVPYLLHKSTFLPVNASLHLRPEQVKSTKCSSIIPWISLASRISTNWWYFWWFRNPMANHRLDVFFRPYK